MRKRCSRSSATRLSTSTRTSRRRLSNGCARGSRSSNQGCRRTAGNNGSTGSSACQLPNSSVTFKQRCIPTTARPSPTSSPALTGVAASRQAVQAMISELAEHYQVHILSTVLKRENLRSMRLLERLGFSLASPEQHMEHRVEPRELLMVREIERI